MTTCQVCERKSDLWLCGSCQAKLRAALADLPWWLDRLAETAVGQVKLGDGGRGGTRRDPYQGDDEVLARCACGHGEHDERRCEAVDRTEIASQWPDDGTEIKLEACMCAEYRPVTNQAKIRARFLAAGRVNSRASALFDEIVNTLGTTIRDLCETRGIDFTPVRSVEQGFVGPLLTGWRRLPRKYAATPLDAAEWLTEAISAIASSEGAGEAYSSLTGLTGRIERIVNRPVAPRFVGPCPTNVDSDHDRNCRKHHPHACGNRLMAKREAIEITCRSCKRTHNIEALIRRLLADVDHWRFSVPEIHQIVDLLGEQLPERTFRHWRRSIDGKPPKLKPSGYRNGTRITISRHADTDEPLYRLADVRRAMDERKVKA